MSDFAIGFYEIVYKKLINRIGGKLLSKEGYLINKEFAGDTMNSFNSLATIILGDCGNKQRISKSMWPEYLREYNKQYHCLANFWLIPMRIGRTSAKMSRYDSLDYFLSCVEEDFDTFCVKEYINYNKGAEKHNNYFRYFDGWNDFRTIHFIKEHSIRHSPLDYYKTKNIKGCEELVLEAISTMKQRAEEITLAHGEELCSYFEKYL